MIFALLLSLVVSKSIVRPAPTPVAVVARTQSATLELGGAKLVVEVVDNDSLRTLGLSHRPSLDWSRGMLFVFPQEARRAFWMIDCKLDLDIA